MTDYTISCKLSNETVYACYRGRFWRWDGSIWKESHLMTQKFERAKAADKKLTPQAFLTNGAEFAPLDEYELPEQMLTALREAKPCKNAPIEPVEEHPTPSAQCSDAATAAENQTAASPAAPEGSSPTTELATAADAPGVPVSADENAPVPSSTAPTFDFGADDQTNALLLQDDEWLMVGMALKDSGLPVTIWEQWSTRDAGRYHKGECVKKWESFHGGGASPVTASSIFQLAYSHGWSGPAGHALDWNDDISAGTGAQTEGRLVDPRWVEAHELALPEEWHPADQLKRYLQALFEPDEYVAYVTESFIQIRHCCHSLHRLD